MVQCLFELVGVYFDHLLGLLELRNALLYFIEGHRLFIFCHFDPISHFQIRNLPIKHFIDSSNNLVALLIQFPFLRLDYLKYLFFILERLNNLFEIANIVLDVRISLFVRLFERYDFG